MPPATDPTPEEETARLVSEAAAEVLRHDLPRNRALRFALPGHDPARLAKFAELGWTLLAVPEDRGGLGLGLPALAALAEELGCVLSPEPVIPLALVAARLDLPGLVEGRPLILPAFAGTEAPILAGGRLTGRPAPVLLGAAAAGWLVETADGAALVEAGAPGVTCTAQPTHDGGHLARLHFDGSPARAIPGSLRPLAEAATLAHAAYLLGLATRAFDITLDHLCHRRQFDRPLGAFQALQHRMADLFTALLLARATVEEAAAEGSPRAISLARAQAGEAADLVTRAAIQLHGGIGYTDEADIGLYLRKAMVLSGLYGTPRQHRLRALDLLEAGE